MLTIRLCFYSLALATLLGGTSHAERISKPTAAFLAGPSGVSRVQLRQLQTKLSKVTRDIKQPSGDYTDRQFDQALAAAVSRANLTKAERTAIWSAKGTALMISDPDGMANQASKAGILGVIRGDVSSLRSATKGPKLTADSLYAAFGAGKANKGHTGLSSFAENFLLAARTQK
jgi:hypothetical protein